MNILKKKFKRSGFNHVQVKRAGRVAMYERTPVKGTRKFYEVIKIGRHNGYYACNQYIEAAETYPGASLWGIAGWTCNTIEIAEKKFKSVCKRANKRKKLAYA